MFSFFFGQNAPQASRLTELSHFTDVYQGMTIHARKKTKKLKNKNHTKKLHYFATRWHRK